MNKNKNKNPISIWLDEYLVTEFKPPVYTLDHRDLNTYYLYI